MYGVVNYDPNKVYTHISDDLKAVWKKVCMSLCDLASFNHIYWEKWRRMSIFTKWKRDWNLTIYTYLFIYLSVYIFVYVPIYHSFCLSIDIFVCMYV